MVAFFPSVPKRIIGAHVEKKGGSKDDKAALTAGVPLLDKLVSSPTEKRDISKEETPSLNDLCRRLSSFKNKVMLFLQRLQISLLFYVMIISFILDSAMELLRRISSFPTGGRGTDID